MTRDEALREIGVAPGSSQDEIRRAYLRKLKTRKPEVDPEGFRRLREAFECLREEPEPSPESLVQPRPADEQPASPAADEKITRLEMMEDPEELCSAAEDWLLRGQPASAVEAMLRAMESADALGEPWSPDPQRILVLLVRLQAHGFLDEASSLQDRFASRLRSSGRELDLLDDQDAALWQIAQELARLPPDRPARFRLAIGLATISPDPEASLREIAQLARDYPEEAERMAAQVVWQPVLSSLYGAALAPAPLPIPRPPGAVPDHPSWRLDPRAVVVFLAVGAILVLWFFSMLPSGPPPSSEELMASLCPAGAHIAPSRVELCQASRDAFSSLRQHRCDDARAAREKVADELDEIRHRTYSLGVRVIDEDLLRVFIDRELGRACGETSE